MIIKLVLSNKETGKSFTIENVDTYDRKDTMRKLKAAMYFGNWNTITFHDVEFNEWYPGVISPEEKHYNRFKNWICKSKPNINNLKKPTWRKVSEEIREKARNMLLTTDKKPRIICNELGFAATGATQYMNSYRGTHIRNISKGIYSPSID